MLIAKFDGACEPINPGGDAACAVLIERDGVEVYRQSQYLGFGTGMTCNVAEFRGLMPKEPMRIIGDSMIVIRRMTGKAKHPPVGVCAPLAEQCVRKAHQWRNLLSFQWQSRAANQECDAMSALEIEEKMLELEADDIDKRLREAMYRE